MIAHQNSDLKQLSVTRNLAGTLDLRKLDGGTKVVTREKERRWGRWGLRGHDTNLSQRMTISRIKPYMCLNVDE